MSLKFIEQFLFYKRIICRRDLSRAVKLLEMVKRREKMKKDDLQLSIDIYEKRYQAKDYTGQLLQEYTAATTKSRYFGVRSDAKIEFNHRLNSRPAFAPLYSNQFYHNASSNSVSHSNQWNSSQNYPSIHLNHHHLQNKRDFDGMSTSSSRKEKRQYKKRKHKVQREPVIKQGKKIPPNFHPLMKSIKCRWLNFNCLSFLTQKPMMDCFLRMTKILVLSLGRRRARMRASIHLGGIEIAITLK